MSDDSKLKRAIESGLDLVAGLAGAGAGVVTGDPFVGSAVTWAVPTLSKIGLDVVNRVGERSSVRAGAAIAVIADDTSEHEARGDRRRSDGFFDSDGMLRADSEELIEAVLLAAVNCFEERKLPHMAHIYGVVAFNTSIRPADALFLLRVADQLTYRQFLALCLFAQHGRGRIDLERELAQVEADHREGVRGIDPALAREMRDLGDRGLIGAWEIGDLVLDPTTTFGGDWEGISIGRVALTSLGMLLCELLQLEAVTETAWRGWLDEYRGPAR